MNEDYKNSSTWKYIEWIKENPEKTCKKLRKLYLGIIEPILEGTDPDFYFDPKPGRKFIEFCEGKIEDNEQLNDLLKKAPDGSNRMKMAYIEKTVLCGFIRQSMDRWDGLPLILLPYQKAYEEIKYGIKWKSTGKRRYSETFLLVARKNGKTTLEAPEAIYSLLTTKGGEIYVSASVYSQARKLWDESLTMISSSPLLDSIFAHRVNPQAEIYFKPVDGKIVNSSTYKVLSKEVKSQDGLNVSHAIIDEVHALPRKVYDVLKQATSARSEALIDLITTAGFVRQGLFDDEYDYAKQVLDGTVNDTTILPVIYELDEGDKWETDETCWYKANPGLGMTKSIDFLRSEVKRAKTDLNSRSTVMTKDFNIIGISKNQWLTPEQINNPTEYNDEAMKKFENTTCIGAYDLSKTGDATCAAIAMFDQETKKMVLKMMFWITKDFLLSPECKASRVPWDAWIERGLVSVSGDHAINYHDVSKWFLEQVNTYGYYLAQIGYDAWSSQYLVDELNSMGFSKNECQVPVRQGNPSLIVPIQSAWSMLSDHTIDYLDNPVMKWMLSNVEMTFDSNNNPLPVHKGLKRGNKIDGFSVLLDVLYILSQNSQRYIDE